MQTAASTIERQSSLEVLASSLLGKIALGLAATVVVAAAAHVSIPLPFTPVPLTLQPLAVLGVGLALGPTPGFITMVAYLLEGLVGLPVFSPTGPGGILQLLGPTGGYLMAYPFVAALVGGLTRTFSNRMARFPAALIAGHIAMAFLLTCGALWFMNFTHHSFYATWIGAVAPFLPGEIVKVFAAAGIYSALHRTARIQ
jgi:biotin transport system substrate-specific component